MIVRTWVVLPVRVYLHYWTEDANPSQPARVFSLFIIINLARESQTLERTHVHTWRSVYVFRLYTWLRSDNGSEVRFVLESDA